MSESTEVNVSELRKELKQRLGDTCYGQKEFDVKNHDQNVAWIASPETKKRLKPFEKLYEFVDDRDEFLNDLNKSLSGDVADAREVLAVMKKHLTSKKQSKLGKRRTN